jgi:hypothetical protein
MNFPVEPLEMTTDQGRGQLIKISVSWEVSWQEGELTDKSTAWGVQIVAKSPTRVSCSLSSAESQFCQLDLGRQQIAKIVFQG